MHKNMRRNFLATFVEVHEFDEIAFDIIAI